MPWSFVKFSQLIISVVGCIQKLPPTLLFRGGGGGGGFTQVRSITIGDKSFYQKKWTAENELTISLRSGRYCVVVEWDLAAEPL